jgi:cobalt/nickel transport system permease protein
MMFAGLAPLFAVHIADNVLTDAWWLGGLAGAGLLLVLGAWRLHEEEIPKIALLTAAFFVASSIHVRVPPTSAHLLLNGLVGVILGRRAGLAIVVGVTMQALLLGHGGYTTIGINSCVMALPALFAWQLFNGLQRLPWLEQPWFRSGLVALSVLAWLLSLVYSSVVFASNRMNEPQLDLTQADALTFYPATLMAAVVLAALAAWGERRLENQPEFPIGLLVGELSVLLTLVLNSMVLVLGGNDNWQAVALFVLIAQLPLAVIEGVVLGFTVGFLVRVKPELLAWLPAEKTACSVDSMSEHARSDCSPCS